MISVERDKLSSRELHESNFDKRMLYEKKRKFRKFQKDEIYKHASGRSMGSAES